MTFTLGASGRVSGIIPRTMQPRENLLVCVEMKRGSRVPSNQFSGQGGKSTVCLAIAAQQP